MRRVLVGVAVLMAAAMSWAGAGSPPKAGNIVAALPAHPTDADLARLGFRALDDGRVPVMIELAAEPAARVWARTATRHGRVVPEARIAATDATRAQLSTIRRLQDDVSAMVRDPQVQGTVIYRVSRVYDGIAALVAPESLRLIAGLPGVAAVRPLPEMRLSNAYSVPLIRAPEVWDGAGAGVRGEGVKIGIIDTGIDYIHRDFGGSGNYAGQVFNDSTVPWTQKVVGGYDFAGDDYNPDTSAGATPHPDGDPMDCNGHGSHVAGTAAGYGVTSGGLTYTGPWDASTNTSSLRIGPGVAPQAQLYALKVFGCSGSTSLTLQALDWAVDPNNDSDFSDHLDVVNLSLGSPFGAADESFATAINNASLAGVIVACAAGNDGPTTGVTDSPGVATRSIAVASSVDEAATVDGFSVTSPASVAGTYPSTEAGFGPNLATVGDLSGALAYPSSNRTACGPFAPAVAGELSGRIALVDRGSCTFEKKVKYSQDAGATGVIVVNNVPGAPFTMAEDPTFNATITIPSILTTLGVGDTLKAALASSAVQATLTASLRDAVAYLDPSLVDTLSSFSSLGPSLPDAGLKPDLAAPGDSIFSALTKTGNQGASFSGTSMATPHIAGSAALIRQLHPDWTVEEVKAALMNTAQHDLFVGANQTPPVYTPQRVGAGRVDLVAAAATRVLAMSDDTPGSVGVSFGMIEVVGRTVATRTVRIENTGPEAESYALSYRAISDPGGVEIALPSQVTIPAGGSQTVQITLSADASQIGSVRDASLADSQDGEPRFWLTEAAGQVVLTPLPAGQQAPGWDGALRVPVYAALVPVGAMTVVEQQVPSGDSTLHLDGTPPGTGGDAATDVVPLAGAFELGITDPDEPDTVGSTNMEDIAFVGVRSDYAARGDLANTVIEFAVAMVDRWMTPNQISLKVNLDTDRNGTTDYTLSLTNTGAAAGGDGSDAFIAQLCRIGSQTCTSMTADGLDPRTRNTALMGSNVVILPVRAGDLGLTAGSSRFNYSVRTSLDSTSTASFDPTSPGVSLGAGVTLPAFVVDRPGATIPIHVDAAALTTDGASGVLVVHLHNPTPLRAQAIPYSASTCSLGCSASVPSDGMVAQAVAFTATPQLGSCAGPVTVTWDFGDGSPGETSLQTSHTYTVAGSYVWSATTTAGAVSCKRTGVIRISAGTFVHSLIIGAIAHNRGVGTSRWRSGVAVVNPGALPANASLTYRDGTGTHVAMVSLPPGAERVWPDVAEGLFGIASGAESSGTLRIDSDRPVRAVSRTYNQADQGTFGQSIPALEIGAGAVPGEVALLPSLSGAPSFRTNVGFVNTSAASCTATVTIHGPDGTPLGHPVSNDVAAGGWLQVNDVFTATGATAADGVYGAVDLAGDGCSAWSYASVVDNGTDDPTTVAGAVASSLAAGTRLIGGVSHNQGGHESVWRTDLAVVNPDSASNSLSLTYTPVAGAPVVQTLSLAAGASMLWRDLLESAFGVATGVETQGTVVIASDAPVAVVARTFNSSAAGTFGQAMPGLVPSEGLVVGETGILPQLRGDQAFRTNIGIVNLGTVSCSVRVTLLDGAGNQLGDPFTIDAPAGQWRQQSDAFAAAHAPAETTAYARVEVLTPGGVAWAYGSVVDNVTNDPTTIAVQRSEGAVAAGTQGTR